jgi:hypothetical protein
MNNQHRPIPDSYWVTPGKFLAGEYPRNLGDESSRAKLRQFLEAGVTCFLDLTEAGESRLEPYADLLREETAALGRSAEYRRLSIPDVSIPSVAHMRHILDTIDEQLAAGAVVYVHCWGGVGRTATVVGCHLVRHGLSGEESLARITELRAGTPKAGRRSPETAAQAEMVRHWQEL